jgi:hypothetical protein
MDMILKQILSDGVAIVNFTKADGSERIMRCTTYKALMPAPLEATATTVRKVSDEVCPVWDLDVGAWRCFRWDSIINYEKEIA